MNLFSKLPIIFFFLIVSTLSSGFVTTYSFWFGSKEQMETFKLNKLEQINQRLVELQGTLNDFNRRGNELAMIREVSRLTTNRELELLAIVDADRWVYYATRAELRQNRLPESYTRFASLKGQLHNAVQGKVHYEEDVHKVHGVFPLEALKVGENRGSKHYYLYAIFSLERSWQHILYHFQQEMIKAGVFHTLFFFLAFSLLYWVIKGRINKIVFGAQTLASGDYRHRIRLQGGDEFQQIGLAIDNMAAALEKQTDQLIELAEKDALTGLYNRYKFFKLVEDQIDLHPAQPFAIFFIDLDRFKVINDTLGHDVGDKYLKVVGQRLKRVLSKGDMLSRFGGDEFCILFHDIFPVTKMERLGEQILELLREPVMIGEQSLFSGASIGVSLYPQDGRDIHELIKTADIAMYHTKNGEKNSLHFYHELFDPNDPGLLEMTAHIKQEIERGHVFAFFQPQIDTQSGNTTGYEALARMKAKDGGWLSPAQFIPIVEENGWMIQFSEVMYRNALKTYCQWVRRQQSDDVPTLSLNLSAIQLDHPRFLEKLDAILQQFPEMSRHIELEITEDILINNIEEKIAVLKALRIRGIRIALDDFGTGYSSLSYLKKIPLDRLKVDQSFVRDINQDINSNAIVETIIDMAHNLGLEVISEGVETEEQLSFLQAHNCYAVQGYLTGKPQERLP
ncbi:GGDEF domain-containing protein [Thiomicrorhabdus sp. zzn3]|uniref:putative bifunctional diguanylate cyclase/phosphodiesterase n=1 Tax=Thiomicrorhabdus sp. zzn3 TaxID=3039775 RepID=UPI0024366E21|nr:GGDEF domain-containing protein [Thiomicrorhabdus sp. zzn3]MDG6777399.1 GGDEF domain-containing protein [Thiomicrorhabdus sp. zzn3]